MAIRHAKVSNVVSANVRRYVLGVSQMRSAFPREQFFDYLSGDGSNGLLCIKWR